MRKPTTATKEQSNEKSLPKKSLLRGSSIIHNQFSTSITSSTTWKDKISFFFHKQRLYPVHPLFLVAVAPFLPTWFYLNRGFTVWYHLLTCVYLLTKKEPLRRMIMVLGTSLTMGWYAALVNDYFQHGRFAHILYMNTPTALKNRMFNKDDDNNGGDDDYYGAGHVFYTNESMGYMMLSHVTDVLLHPGIVYLLYRAHRSEGGTVKDIVTWNTIAATFILGRVWGTLHSYYNDGVIRLWYIGYEVYHIHDLDSWIPAYVMEGLCLAAMAIYKLRTGST